MNMVDHLTGPMAGVSSSASGAVSDLQSLDSALGSLVSTGSAMATLGQEITSAVLAPVEATFATQTAIGELTSLGVEDLESIKAAAVDFSNTWKGTTAPDFITAAYDIKSGIASLSDEGVAEYTKLSGLTAVATKSTTEEMTSLFATSYGIYKNYYEEMSDIEFGEMFSSGLSTAVRLYKTSGSEMSASISRLGAAATNANVPMEEQLAILGALQATMGGSEAGTKYAAFLRSAVKGGAALGLEFLDANNQLKSLPEILDQLKGKYGDTIDAIEKMEIQEAFGDTLSVQFIDLFYNKTDQLQSGILDLYDSMGTGLGVTTDMANAINSVESSQYEVLQQQIGNLKETIGSTLLPTVNNLIGRASNLVLKCTSWAEKNQDLVRTIMLIVLALGGFLTVAGTTIAVIGGIGLVFTKSIGIVRGFIGAIKAIPSILETIQIAGMLAADKVKAGFLTMKSGAATAITAIKTVALNILNMAKTAAISAVTALKTMALSLINMAKTAAINGVAALKSMTLGLISMAKQAIIAAATALPGVIAGVWSFTAALLANPITWIVIGIAALIAALVLLWQNWDTVTAFIKSLWNGACNAVQAGIEWIKGGLSALGSFFSGIGQNIASGCGIIKSTFQAVISWVQEKIGWFRDSGKRIIETLVEGIKSAASKPVEAVKGIFQNIRNMLPFSDAKVGPLSTLTLSGQRTMTTIAEGIRSADDAPADAVERGFHKIETTREPVKRVAIHEIVEQSPKQDTDANAASNGSRQTTIQNLNFNIDINKLKELLQLLKILDEIEDNQYSYGIGSDTDAVTVPT